MSYNHYPKNLWTLDDVKDMVNDWLVDNHGNIFMKFKPGER